MHWQRLDRDGTLKVIDSVKSASDPGLITAGTSEVERARLLFYENIYLYKITNYASLPSFTFEYLGDGTFFQYLDGTEVPIYAVNDKGGLILAPETAVPYLEFFFRHVSGEDGVESVVMKNPQDMPMIDSLDGAAYESIIRGHRKPEVKADNRGGFVVETDLYEDGALIRAGITISASGRVAVVGRKMVTHTLARGAGAEGRNV